MNSSFSQTPYGPSSAGCCEIRNGNACGTGSLVGVRNGNSLVFTNAHVAGTRIGKAMRTMFPHDNRRTATGRVIMAGYSDRIMMDWAVLELDQKLNLPHVKLMNQAPTGEHYTGGFPRCEGPYYQRLITRGFVYNGTVWKWQPNSIGGQSGSAVHSFENHLQYGLLTWSWGGDGAGQTVKSIWHQYINRAVIGFPRPEGLIELAGEVAEDLEEGFYQQTNITTLPIWHHLDDTPTPEPPSPEDPVDPKFLSKILKIAEGMQLESSNLMELIRNYQPDQTPDDEDQSPGNGPLFGL